MSFNKFFIENIVDKLKRCSFEEFVNEHFSKNFSWEIKGTSCL